MSENDFEIIESSTESIVELPLMMKEVKESNSKPDVSLSGKFLNVCLR